MNCWAVLSGWLIWCWLKWTSLVTILKPFLVPIINFIYHLPVQGFSIPSISSLYSQTFVIVYTLLNWADRIEPIEIQSLSYSSIWWITWWINILHNDIKCNCWKIGMYVCRRQLRKCLEFPQLPRHLQEI